MKLTNQQINDIADILQGSCLSLEDGICAVLGDDATVDDLDLDDYYALDEVVFLCASCNWWYEAGYWNSEKTDENYCLDCEPENDYD